MGPGLVSLGWERVDIKRTHQSIIGDGFDCLIKSVQFGFDAELFKIYAMSQNFRATGLRPWNHSENF